MRFKRAQSRVLGAGSRAQALDSARLYRIWRESRNLSLFRF